MTLNSLILFAAVYFAAVATPGPGVAALISRVLGQGLKGVWRRSSPAISSAT
jgi:threonine/homoserine/homoserine lactone efflux protein